MCCPSLSSSLANRLSCICSKVSSDLAIPDNLSIVVWPVDDPEDGLFGGKVIEVSFAGMIVFLESASC